MKKPLSSVAVVLLLFAAGCGSSESTADVTPAAPVAGSTPAAEKPAPKPKPVDDGDCGDVSVPPDGSDQPSAVKAEGVGCDEALSVAKSVTTKTEVPSGWSCPNAATYGQVKQKCTRGGDTVTWTVKFL